MADSKAQGLAKRTLDSLAAITGVRLWSGKTGDPNLERAQGVEMSEFVSSDIVENTDIDYKALTPKGFYQSVATEDRKGIAELATDAEIASEASGKFLEAADQAKMREHWAKASAVSNQLGRPKMWKQDGIGEGETVPIAYKFTINFNTLKGDTTTKVYYPQPFTMPSGKRILYAVINGVYASSQGIGNAATNNASIDTTLSTKNIHMGSSGFQLVFPASTAPMYISITNLSGRFSCVLDIFAIIG